MSQYQAIKAATNAYIKTNGRQEITGAILNAVMIATIDSLGKFYQFYGNATPDTDPGSIDQNVAFLASTPGTYTHLGGFTITPGEFAVIKFDGEWKKEVVIVIPTRVSQLFNDAGFITNAVADLVNYYTKGETYTKAEVNSILTGYYDKDEVDSLVDAITGQSYIVAWDGTAEPIVADIPAGVVVTYNATPYTGTLAPSADTIRKIYLVSNGAGYDMYVTTENSGYSWVGIGTTSLDLSGYATKAELTQLEADIFGIPGESEHIEQQITQGTAVSTSVKHDFNSPLKAGRTYKIRVSGSSAASFGIYLYDSNNQSATGVWDEGTASQVTRDWQTFTSGVNTRTFKPTNDIPRYGFYVSAANAVSTGTMSVDIVYQGVPGLVDVINEKIDGVVTDISLDFVGAGTTGLNKDFPTTIGKAYDVLLPETAWSVDELTNPNLATFVVRSKSGGTYTDIASTRVLCAGFDARQKIYSFVATTDTSNIFVRGDTGQNLTFRIQEHNVPSVVGNYILGKRNENRFDTMQVFTEVHGRYIHHLNVELASPTIPSQSLFDIAYAKALGFGAIEANLQKCSDDVYVTKHGNGGKLGVGLVFADGCGIDADTLFSAVSSTDLRNYVTYDSTMAKYGGHIPTLAEFCKECARLNIVPFLRGCTTDALAEARKYLPDDRIIVEWTYTSRLDFKGVMTKWEGGATASDILATCEKYGRPFYYGWSTAGTAGDSLFEEVSRKLHEKGYAFGTCYLDENNFQRLHGKGMDIYVPNYRVIPPFYSGNVLNIIGGGDEHLVLNNASYDGTTDTITMSNGGTIKVSNEKIGSSLSKVCVRVRYNGTLSIKFNGYNQNVNLVSYNSDGSDTIEVSAALEKVGTDFLTIEAGAATTIYDLAIFASVVM